MRAANMQKLRIIWDSLTSEIVLLRKLKITHMVEEMKADLGIPKSIRETGVTEADFLARVDKLSEDAFDDQCTGANPRYPLISEIKQLLLDFLLWSRLFEHQDALVIEKRKKSPQKNQP